jgi:hypothetical protein
MLIAALLLGCLIGGTVTACGALVVGALFHHGGGDHGRYDVRNDRHQRPGDFPRDRRGPVGPGPVNRPPAATTPAPTPTAS